MLAKLGFKALATTSTGFDFASSWADGTASLDDVLAHCRDMVAATDLPVSADLENCYADTGDGIAETIRRAAETGLAGCSIEDMTDDPDKPICEFSEAVDRVSAAVKAVRALPRPFTLTARAENFIRGNHDIDDTIKRLQAFSAAGADVLYAPGLASLEQVRQVRAEVETPLNVLAPFIAGATVAELTAAGAKRISVGSALNSVAINSLLRAGSEMLDEGSLAWTAQMASPKIVAEFLS